MALERFGLKRKCVLWCVWFALLMSAPYAPGSGSMWTIGWGAAATSKMFGYVAAGIVIGLWCGTLPRFERMVVSRPFARIAVCLVGIALSLVVLLATWANFFMAVFCVPDFTVDWTIGLPSNDKVSFIAPFVKAMGDCLPFLALAASLFCGWSAVSVFHSWLPSQDAPVVGVGQKGVSRPGAPSRAQPGQVASLFKPRVAVSVFMPFAMGTLQPLAWVLLMPHNVNFPQPIPGVDAIASVWDANGFHEALPLLLPFTAMLVFSLVSLCVYTPSSDKYKCLFRSGHTGDVPITGNAGLVPVTALCSGVVLFRMLVRICPGILRVQFAAALLAFVLYVMACTWFVILMLRSADLEKSVAPSVPESVGEEGRHESIADALSEHDRDTLRSYGLTEKEMLVVCAHVLGLTSAQAGEAMGIAEPTVREYRRRCRVKVGTKSMDELVEMIGLKSCDTAASVSKMDGHEEGHLPRFASTVPFLILLLAVACMVLGVFPSADTEVRWDDVWTISFGMACGLVGAWMLQICIEPAALCAGLPSRKFIFALACVLIVGSALDIVLIRFDCMPLQTGTARRVVCLVGYAGFIMGVGTLIHFAVGLYRASAGHGCGEVLGLIGTGCVALAIDYIGGLAWAVAFMTSTFGAIALLFHLLHTERLFADDSRLLDSTDDFMPLTWETPWLLAFGLAAWALGEIWRSQNFDSSIGLVQWGVLAVLVMAAISLKLNGAFDARILAIGFVIAAVFAALCGMERIGVLMAGLFALMSSAQEGASHCRAKGYPWHSPLLSGAFCLTVGTLTTDSVDVFDAAFVAGTIIFGLDSNLLVGLAIPIVVVVTVALCLFDVLSGKTMSLSLDGEERVRSALMARGLSIAQVDIVVLLASGLSVGDVARELHYSRSTVALARRQAYATPGVSDRKSLVAALGILSSNIPGHGL